MGKHQRKVAAKLAWRIAEYEQTVKHQKTGASAFKQPGSQNLKKG